MRVVLADLKGTEGLVTKDTVAGGYGSRFVPFSLTTHWFCHVKRSYVQIPSVQMAYLAAICARNGHEVVWTRSEVADGDVALVLSSLVDYRRETAWAEAARARGMRVGFVGLACSKLPETGGGPQTLWSRLGQASGGPGHPPLSPVGPRR